MQCFQKDPNLRVSARKLLKHPWIVNANRSESVVPKKSTEYEEAVKSVQEWNEALRSPESASVRKSLPILVRQDVNRLVATTGKEYQPSTTQRITVDRLGTPEDATNDNWDDDFATAISPSALHLPHLRPHDHLGGLLSSDRLKTFASIDSGGLRSISGSFEDGDATVKSPLQLSESDPLQTVRHFPRSPPQEEKPRTNHAPRHRHSKSALPSLGSVPQPKPSPPAVARPFRQTRPTALYKESSVEDFSDIILANDDVLERKLGVLQVSICCHVSVLLDDIQLTILKGNG